MEVLCTSNPKAVDISEQGDAPVAEGKAWVIQGGDDVVIEAQC